MRNRAHLSAYLFATCILFATVGHAEGSDPAEVTKIDVNGALEYVGTEDDAVIMDVRTPVEFEMSHIPDAVNLNVQDEAFAEMAASLDRDKTYIVHCTKNPGNGRSNAAIEKLQELGFKNLYTMEGGWVAWKEAELPLVQSAN